MTYPVTKDDKINSITKVMTSYSHDKNWGFSLGSRELGAEYAFGFFGILPMFLLEAKEHYEKIYNNHYSADELLDVISPKRVGDRDVPFEVKKKDVQYMNTKVLDKKFPLQFFETPPQETILDFEPRIEHLMDNDKSISFSTIIHFVMYSLDEYVKVYEKSPNLLIDGKIPLDPLCDKWIARLAEFPEYVKLYPLEAVQEIDAKKQRGV